MEFKKHCKVVNFHQLDYRFNIKDVEEEKVICKMKFDPETAESLDSMMIANNLFNAENFEIVIEGVHFLISGIDLYIMKDALVKSPFDVKL